MTSAAGQRKKKDEMIKGEVEMEREEMVGGEGRLGGTKMEKRKDKSRGGEQVRVNKRKR